MMRRPAMIAGGLALLTIVGCASSVDAAAPDAWPQDAPLAEVAVPTEPGAEPFLTSGWSLKTDILSPFEDRVHVDPRETNLDERGVAAYEHYQTGEIEYHPIYIAQAAMGALREYALTGDQMWLDSAVTNAQELVDTRVDYGGGWWFQYEFDWTYYDRTLVAPWWSGMAQGEALTVFSHLARLQPENPQWREAADRTFDSFLLRGSGNEAPWATVVIDGQLWFEEYAGNQPPLQVLNGQVFALFGLWEYWALTSDERAARYFDGGATTVLVNMPRIRNEGGVSYYCAQVDYCRTPGWLNESYHPIHIQQLNALGRITGDERFAEWAALLDTDWQPETTEAD